MHFPPLSVHRMLMVIQLHPIGLAPVAILLHITNKNRGYPFKYHPLLTSYEQFNSEYRSGILYSYFYL